MTATTREGSVNELTDERFDEVSFLSVSLPSHPPNLVPLGQGRVDKRLHPNLDIRHPPDTVLLGIYLDLGMSRRVIESELGVTNGVQI